MSNITSINQDDVSYRPLPANLEAEQALLGALLINNNAIEKVHYLKPEHFYEPVHGRIFEAIKKLADAGKSADPIKLKPYFEDDEALDEVGGTKYIVRLASSAPTVFNPEDYAETIRDLSLRRDLIHVGEKIMLTAYDAPIDSSAKDQIAAAEQDLYQLSGDSYRGGFVSFDVSLEQALDAIESARKAPDGLSGITTGLKPMNVFSGGIDRRELTILAGTTAMGKTALGTNIAYSAAKAYEQGEHGGAKVGFFSIEMGKDQIANRIIAQRVGIDGERLRRGQINQTEMRGIARAKDEIRNLPLFIDDTAGIRMSEIRSRARRLKRLQGIELLVVDYLQLAHDKAENRQLEVTKISRGLQALAKELDIGVLALAQLSRNIDYRTDKRPMLSDLRESGTIEQEAAAVIFIYRPEYYLEKTKPDIDSKEYEKWQKGWDKWVGRAEINWAKRRHGPTGSVVLGFKKETTEFYELKT